MPKLVQPAVPAIAPATGVEDARVRRALQDLTDAHNTRNGQSLERFITARELKDLAPAIAAAGLRAVFNRGATAPRPGVPGGDAIGLEPYIPVRDLIDALEREIEQSWLFRHLGERVDNVLAANGRTMSLVRELNEGVTQQLSVAIGETQAVISSLDALKVGVNDNVAAIVQEATVRSTADEALAAQITSLTAQVGANAAAIVNEASVRATADSAQASQISTLQAQVGSNSTAISVETAARIAADGQIRSHWSVRLDTNGWVAGIGLVQETNGSAPPTSALYIRADRFAIGNPAVPVPAGTTPPAANIPFVVQTTATTDPTTGAPIPAGVYIKDAFIKNADIGTLKIGGNAVTIPLIATFGTTNITSNTQIASLNMPDIANGAVIAIAAATLRFGAESLSDRFASMTLRDPDGVMLDTAPVTVYDPPASRTVEQRVVLVGRATKSGTYTVVASSDGANPRQALNVSLTLIGAKR